MEPVIRRFVDWCFTDGTVKWIAWRILRSMENDPKNDMLSLQILTIKAIVKRKMRKCFYGKLLYSLVFRVPTNVIYFVDRFPCLSIRQSLKRFISDKLTGYRKKRELCLELRKDPYIMMAICEQLMEKGNYLLTLRMTKTDLIIKCTSCIFAIIPNKDNREYDTFWAAKFFQFFLQKHYTFIWLQVEGEGEHQRAEMKAVMYTVIDSVFPKRVPERGWINELARGDRTVYRKFSDVILDYTRFTNQFEVVREHYPDQMPFYWRSVDKI